MGMFGFGNTDADGNNTGFNWGQLLGQGAGVGAAGLQGLFPQSQNSTTNSNTTNNGITSGTQSGMSSQMLQSLANLFGSSSTTGATQNQLGPEGQALLQKMGPLMSTMSIPFNKDAVQGAAGNNINAGALAQQRNANEAMAARGLADSPTSAVTNAGIDASRIGQQVQVANSMPQAEQAYNTQNLNNLSGILQQLPRNSQTSSNQQQQQSTDSSQSGSGTTYGTMNGSTYNAGTNNSTTKVQPSGGFSGLLNGVGSALGALFGI